jgi:Cdc6-like AAA superfamily ATPase
LHHIAGVVAGKAHDGLSILRHAAREASDRGQEHITTAVIDAVAEAARADVRQKRLEQLDDHPRAVWDVLDAAGEALSSREVHARYVEAVRNPRGEH